MPDRHLPVRPDLRHLRHQAKDLLRAVRRGDPAARAELLRHHPDPIDPASAKLADAQLALARAYGAPSWPRLVRACELVDAIWRDDLAAVQAAITAHPELVGESALIRPSNWGRPLSYAANLGRDRIIDLLLERGATDLDSALERATLQGQAATARRLHALLGAPPLGAASLSGAAYTLSLAGTEVLFELGVDLQDERGRVHAPVDVVLETDSRNPSAKHRILELYAAHGVELPDTPPMAVHRGRIDLLEDHLRRDLALLSRTFRHEEIYPPELGCHDEIQATHGTPLAGATLLHLAIDYDETGIVHWLLERGMDPDARATVDPDGFGGHTPLFATVVSQPSFWMNRGRGPLDAPLARLLLDRGADPNPRASLRKQIHPGYDEHTLHEYREVTPFAWGERFHRPEFVSRPAMVLISERGGHR